jgi:hypothetical protein
VSKTPKRKKSAPSPLHFPDGSRPVSTYEMRILRDCKTVWLRAYCAAIEAHSADEAEAIAEAAMKAFVRKFY